MAGDGTFSEGGLKGLDAESRQMVLDTIGQLKKRLLTREKIFEFDREEIFPEDTIREMLGPAIGLQLLMIPEAYGGLGGGARDSCAVTREMAKICLGITTAFFVIQLGADPIIVGGTEEQKQKWLGDIAEGKALVAYAVTEPDAGSNVAAIKTKADPVSNDSGEIIGYKINGNKQFISTGGYADFITVLAIAPEGPTFFVMEKDKFEKLEFHIRSEDYFGTLATILDLFRLDILEQKFIYDKDKILKRIVDDLKYLQDNFKITPKK